MMYLKNTGERVNIVAVSYIEDVSVMYRGKSYPVVAQFKVEDPDGKWTDYVTPDGITDDLAECDRFRPETL